MKRAVAFPVSALLVVAVTAVANLAVYQAGMEWFVQRPSIWLVVRNVAAVAIILAGGWSLIPSSGRRRSPESLLLIASALFGVGLAVQFRLGHDAPRQLSNDEIVAVRDSVRAAFPGSAEDSVRVLATVIVRRRNALLRSDFDAARIDTRLARSLERAYGPTKITGPILGDRREAGMDNPLLRFLPVAAALIALALCARSSLPMMLSVRWKAIGFYGALLLCAATFVYLTSVGGIRGANVAPQELLKLVVPVGWAGFLIHYRGALRAASREAFTTRPFVLWLYILGLLTFPLLIFVVVRDFGQFLTIGIAQALLLAYFTRSALYIVLVTAVLAVTVVVLLAGSIFNATALLTLLGILMAAVLAIAWLERFRRRDALWTSGALVLCAYTVVAVLAAQLPFVQRILATPRQRFQLWADLYDRQGDAGWWDHARQIVESLYAFDAGGLFGQGLGRGTPFLIPKAGSDFIFAAIGEELGVVGAALILLAFVMLTVIGLRIARDLGEDSFLGLLVTGYVVLAASQTFIHIAGTMNVLPMTGITLPLVSSGVSSLVVFWGIVGAIVGLGSRRSLQAEQVVIRRDLQDRGRGF